MKNKLVFGIGLFVFMFAFYLSTTPPEIELTKMLIGIALMILGLGEKC